MNKTKGKNTSLLTLAPCAPLASYCAGLVFLMLVTGACAAPENLLPGIQVTLEGAGGKGDISTAIKVLLGLTVLSLAPAILIALTAFTRIVIVLAMLRHALGMPDTPPNTVIVSLALFLTLFTMAPVLEQINKEAFQPYNQGKKTALAAVDAAIPSIRDFMVRQTREQDMALMVDISRGDPPKTIDDISLVQLIPAFMLSELKTAFQIGFVIFLPFLLIDLIVASVLMSMGMLMVPPVMISLPIKILMFVLIDGWSLLARALVSSFH